METIVDECARVLAAAARTEIVAHERECAVRWQNTTDAIRELKASVASQTRQMWVANGMVITALLGLVWWLGNHAFP
jgi:hypothetical protein